MGQDISGQMEVCSSKILQGPANLDFVTPKTSCDLIVRKCIAVSFNVNPHG